MSYPKHHTEPFWPTYRLTGPIKNTNPIGMPSRFGPAMGSYYESKYYQNPVPYTSSDIGEPVPGWGTTVSVAGPARLGVGALGLMVRADTRQGMRVIGGSTPTQPQSADEPPSPLVDAPTPWWVYGGVALVVMGGVGLYGTQKGWF